VPHGSRVASAGARSLSVSPDIQARSSRGCLWSGPPGMRLSWSRLPPPQGWTVPQLRTAVATSARARVLALRTVQRLSMRRTALQFALLLLAGCSGHASKEDQLNASANQSTPDASNVLTAAAANGMNADAAMNAAANAQASNSSTGAQPRYQARPNSAQNPNPPKAGEPPQKVPVGNSF
jgi:hypothetical protein